MRKISAILLAMVLVLSVFVGCSDNKDTDVYTTNDQEEVTETPREVAKTSFHKAAEKFAGGSGTKDDPFQISEAGHLVLLHEMLVKEEKETNFDNTYVEGYYILTKDIALNDISDFENWSRKAPEYGWEPIGAELSLNSFAGVLDGNGHKIYGMFIDADGVQSESYKDYYGLFAELSGTVKDLTVEQSYICASGSLANVGTVAGYIREAKIENCNVDSVIELYSVKNAGGVSGVGGEIKNCTFNGSITQLDDSFVHIGGIVGAGGMISDCTFSGTLSGKGYTGGIVGYGENAKSCINKGTVIGDTAGGISGRSYAAGTNQEIEDSQYAIEYCINEGKVSGTTLAGGIVGWMGNDESDISMSVNNCENKGEVKSDESVAGIIGKLSVERTGAMNVKNCINRADVSGKGKTGGIISEVTGGVLHQEGELAIFGCKNYGKIISEDEYSAGIVAYFLVIGDEVDFNFSVNNCANEGAIQSTGCAGGIIGFSNVGFNAEVSAEEMNFSDDTKFSLKDCKNTGSVTTKSSNSMAGGIVGVYGLGYISAEIKNCENTGAVSVDFALTDEQIKEAQGAAWTEFYQIAGGIVGRIGDGLKLTTAEGVETSKEHVNKENASIQIIDCRSTGAISAPDYSNILNQWEKPLYVNYLGGIVGQCSATKGYAFEVKDCTYSVADRGLGDTKYFDFGTKN